MTQHYQNSDIQAAWDRLYHDCMQCTECMLCQDRTNVVFGSGSWQTEVLFVGEGPGEQEDLKGEAFVGRAGKLLDDMLEIIDLDRTKIFIANIVKCRPPKNRDPLGGEQDACIHWLESQIELIQPKIIVCLGRIAAMRMIKDDFKITQEHGVFFSRDGIKYMALYHPAALLRDPGKKPDTFKDLKALRREILKSCPEMFQISAD